MATNAVLPCSCTTVRRASRVLARGFDAALLPAGLNVTQFAVLRAIERHPREPLSAVADDLCMDRTSLYRALTPLVRAGWIALGAGGDRRSRSARLTPRGRRIAVRAATHWARMQGGIVAAFGAERWRHLAAELQALSHCAGALTPHQAFQKSKAP